MILLMSSNPLINQSSQAIQMLTITKINKGKVAPLKYKAMSVKRGEYHYMQ